MNPLTAHPFFETIYRLRSNEQVLLFEQPGNIHPEDEQDVLHFLAAEWDNECLEYPGIPPDFDPAAASWAAATVYKAAQLLLYRIHKPEEVPALIPAFGREVTAGAILSADLCLRLLPLLLIHARSIDPDDILISLCEQHLANWHYSGIGYLQHTAQPDLATIAAHPSALQLYTDRVIERREKFLAQHPLLTGPIAASMGDYVPYFWKE